MSDPQWRTRGVTVEGLAAELLADIAGERRPWQPLFESWADERGLSLAARRAVRVQILRTRFFRGRR